MRCYVGVDLGSTTTKALILDEDGEIVGRGITNSRSNYDTAAKVAQREAHVDVRLALLGRALSATGTGTDHARFLESVERAFRYEQFANDLEALEAISHAKLDTPLLKPRKDALSPAMTEVFSRIRAQAPKLFEPGAEKRSDFFRDIAGALYLEYAEAVSREAGVEVDPLLNIFDRAIIEVENRLEEEGIESMLKRALDRTVRGEADLAGEAQVLRGLVEESLATPVDVVYVVGTGYGRARLPFSKEHIRSEILCHGLGAHIMFPGTRTVLDIGGQDTKAIQVDGDGIVESFQMNDRCAAGSGRYLGYIADEMQLGLHQLGPLAMQAKRKIRDQLHLHGLRRRRAPGPAVHGREARGRARRAAPGHRAPGPGADLAVGRGVRRVHLDRRGGEERGRGGGAGAAHRGELRRAEDEHRVGLHLHRGPRRGDLRPPDGPRRGEGGMSEILHTAGVDVGTGMVKTVVFAVPDDGEATLLWRRADRIRRRDPIELAERAFEAALAELGMAKDDLAYVATTGEGDRVPFRTGHFYSMTTHARGAIYLDPEARAVADVGALHGRAMRIDARGKVLAQRMTSQCASGTGQFLENIARYLGVTLEEIGGLSAQATEPEAPSGVCAVLAETDVINMVSRGVATPDILKGIHDSMAGRLSKLLKAIGAEGRVLVTGGLSQDQGLIDTFAESVAGDTKHHLEIVTHPEATYAGAIGAALWGAFRFRKLRELEAQRLAS